MTTTKSILLCLLCIGFISCKKENLDNSQGINFSHIDSLLNASVKNLEIPGAVAYISYKGEEVYNSAFGFQDVENSVAMKTNSIFRMASMTKALTAVSILQLVEKGMLELNDPIKNYLPEFANMMVVEEVLSDSTFIAKPATKEITIHHLLTHTSGLGYGFQDDNYNALIIKNNISEGFCSDDRTSQENTRRIASIPLLAEPGEKNIYGLSFEVLSTLIENVTQQRFDRYVIQNILEPLEMNDSYFIIPEPQRYRLASVYEPHESGNGIVKTNYKDIDYPIIETRNFFTGGSDLTSTAKDYNKFLLMLENKGTYNGKTILGENFVKMMLSKQSDLNEGDSYQGYAAWIVNETGAKNGIRPLGSYDFGGFFDTYCWVDPTNNFTAILLLQMYPNNDDDVHWKYQQQVYKVMNELKKQK